jgi:hypothetical protein
VADSDVHEAIQLDADISALVSPSVSELWRAMHGYPAEATGAVAAHRALSGGGGATPVVNGFFAQWSNPSGLTITDGAAWRTSDAAPSYFEDPDGFADPGALPFFSPLIPVGLAGLYMMSCVFQFKSPAATGFVAANIGGSTQVNHSVSCRFGDSSTTQAWYVTEPWELYDGQNKIDIANFLNLSGHDISLVEAEYWALRFGGPPFDLR